MFRERAQGPEQMDLHSQCFFKLPHLDLIFGDGSREQPKLRDLSVPKI